MREVLNAAQTGPGAAVPAIHGKHRMRELLAEIHHKAWAATASVAALAAACALAKLALPAVLAAAAVGAMLMWISEEEKRILAAMAPVGDAPPPALVPAAPRPMVRVRDWANPFPAPRAVRRQRVGGRRVRRRHAHAAAWCD